MKTPPFTFFNSGDECRTLDRLKIPLPAGYVPNWTLHIVQIRPGCGDRIYDFFGTSSVVGGAFRLYPDDLQGGAVNITNEGNGAWPFFRKVPRGFQWLKLRSGIERFVQQLGPVTLPDGPRWSISVECWYMRFDERGRTVRHFAWDDPFGREGRWDEIERYCRQLAEQTLRFPVAPRSAPPQVKTSPTNSR